jgi:hypothetical protein
MSSRLPRDQTIDELLSMARVSIDDPTARSWIGNALAAAQAAAASVRRPIPARQNAQLDTIERVQTG